MNQVHNETNMDLSQVEFTNNKLRSSFDLVNMKIVDILACHAFLWC